MVDTLSLDEIVFDAKGNGEDPKAGKIILKAYGIGAKPLYLVDVEIKFEESVSTSHIRYDSGKGIFIDAPLGLDILSGNSPEQIREMMEEISSVYAQLVSLRYIVLEEKAR
ncbi:hypothetical protein HY496_02925 [Candidatus Woesearchaeota archaeon]|nr:hypothetical protein [Candidatus Woesearchaeota archaeon]